MGFFQNNCMEVVRTNIRAYSSVGQLTPSFFLWPCPSPVSCIIFMCLFFLSPIITAQRSRELRVSPPCLDVLNSTGGEASVILFTTGKRNAHEIDILQLLMLISVIAWHCVISFLRQPYQTGHTERKLEQKFPHHETWEATVREGSHLYCMTKVVGMSKTGSFCDDSVDLWNSTSLLFQCDTSVGAETIITWWIKVPKPASRFFVYFVFNGVTSSLMANSSKVNLPNGKSCRQYGNVTILSWILLCLDKLTQGNFNSWRICWWRCQWFSSNYWSWPSC